MGMPSNHPLNGYREIRRRRLPATSACVLLVLLTCAILLVACDDRSQDFVGLYRSVSESEWQLDLQLEGDGKAQVVLQYWEAGSDDFQSEEYVGSWTVAEDEVTLRYGDSVETLRFDDERSFREFGCPGHGPGLLGTGGTGSRKLFAGTTLWISESLRAIPDPC